MLKTAATEPSDRGLAEAVARVLRAKLDDLGVVDVAGTPDLGLDDLQLALGCVGDTDECLRAVAGHLQVDALVLSTVDHAGDATLLTMTFFNAKTGARQSAVRRAEGPHAANDLIEGVEGQLRELFGLPAPAEPTPPPGPEKISPTPVPKVEKGPGLPVLPFVLAGVGVAALVGGGVLGMMAKKTGDDYAAVNVQNSIDAQHAADLYDKSQRQAKIAYGLFAGGGALAAGGVVLFFVMNGKGDQEKETAHVAITPAFGRGALGVRIAGSFGGAL